MENVENVALEQLKLICADLAVVKSDLVKSDVGELKTGQKALKGMIFGLAGYSRGIDEPVEKIEVKLGIET